MFKLKFKHSETTRSNTDDLKSPGVCEIYHTVHEYMVYIF